MMKKYTVVAVYPDEGETLTEYVKAKDFNGAVKAFWRTRNPEDTGLSIVEVFEGECKSVMSVLWIDHPNAKREV